MSSETAHGPAPRPDRNAVPPPVVGLTRSFRLPADDWLGLRVDIRDTTQVAPPLPSASARRRGRRSVLRARGHPDETGDRAVDLLTGELAEAVEPVESVQRRVAVEDLPRGVLALADDVAEDLPAAVRAQPCRAGDEGLSLAARSSPLACFGLLHWLGSRGGTGGPARSRESFDL